MMLAKCLWSGYCIDYMVTLQWALERQHTHKHRHSQLPGDPAQDAYSPSCRAPLSPALPHHTLPQSQPCRARIALPSSRPSARSRCPCWCLCAFGLFIFDIHSREDCRFILDWRVVQRLLCHPWEAVAVNHQPSAIHICPRPSLIKTSEISTAAGLCCGAVLSACCASVFACVCVCVCVWEREHQRERERTRECQREWKIWRNLDGLASRECWEQM